MEVVEVSRELEASWDDFVARARNGHFLFQRAFMTYHADRFAEASLLVMNRGRVVGALPANRRGDVVYSHQGLTFGGLLVDDAGVSEVMAMLDACAAALHAAGARRLLYKPAPWIYHRRPAQEDLYWLFRRDARLVRREVTCSLRTGHAGPVSALRRRGAAKALRAGLTFHRSGDFDRYWRLLSEVLAARHDAKPVHSVDEIKRLAAAFPKGISLHVAEDPDGEMLAGVVIFQTTEVAHTQYIATGPRGRELGALDGLFTHLIGTLGPQVSYFDFGTSNADDGRTLNAGLIAQKEGFGASAVAHDSYEVDLG